MGKFKYNDVDCPTMSLKDAIIERRRLINGGEMDVCILDCSSRGGKVYEYIVAIVQRPVTKEVK